MSTTVISDFSGEYAFLSNFYECQVVYDKRQWPSVEHAYQAMKTMEPSMQEAIQRARSSAIAKRLGRRVVIRRNWESIKIGIMHQLLRIKFSAPGLRKLLLKTGDAYLVEANTWGDTFWGTVDGKGSNWLGILLMDVREEAKLLEEEQGDSL